MKNYLESFCAVAADEAKLLGAIGVLAWFEMGWPIVYYCR
jgi:hypothetical protein